MIEPALVQLVVAASRLLGRSGASRAFVARDLERLWAEALDDETLVSRVGATAGEPDILVQRPHSTTDLAIELKVVGNAKNLRNRVADLTASAVSVRRLFREEVTLAAILILPDARGSWWTGDATEDLHPDGTLRAAQSLLRNEADAVGYDLVAIGSLQEDSQWVLLSPPSTRSEIDLSQLLERLRGAESGRTGRPDSTDRPTSTAPRRAGPRRALLVADEWRSGLGGISTVNRELAIALVGADCEVTVMLPSVTDGERDDASGFGVVLTAPENIPGLSRRELLATRPATEPDYEPDFIVGHGRVLGPFAFSVKHHHYPRAKRVHIVHTDAEQLEAAKERLGGPSHMTKTDERRALEASLAKSADLVAGVGPSLTASIANSIRGLASRPPDVIELRPGLRDWGATVDPANPPTANQVLVIARAEDFHSKGIDIAAEAVLTAHRRLGNDPRLRPVLVVRGVSPDEADGVKKTLESILQPHVQFVLRPYSPDENALRNDLWQSQVLLMPSRHEGFGLAAHEAIAAGVPVLVSAESGLARLLTELSEPGSTKEVLPVHASPSEVASAWGDALYSVLANPSSAFARARTLREVLLAKTAWSSTVADLLTALDRV